MSEDFLSRWSRRKDEARRAERSAPKPDEPAEASTAVPELSPEDLVRLPKIEDLTANSDITAFLRRNVPEALRNAALRRMWLLDPAIRDFEGHARDYAYDWNMPGGAPGHGALEPGEDVAAMVRRIFDAAPDDAADKARAPAGQDGDASLKTVQDQSGSESEGDQPLRR